MFLPETSILIVDDIAAERSVLRKGLMELGLSDVTEAEDGEDAWDEIMDRVLAKRPFQLILSDATMPMMDGVELLRKVRAVSEMTGVPFIVLAAERERDRAAAATRAGASSILKKPVTFESLAETLFAVWEKTAGKKA